MIHSAEIDREISLKEFFKIWEESWVDLDQLRVFQIRASFGI